MKNNKKIIISLIAVIILVSLVCVVSVVYNFLGGFYYCRVIKYDTMLGEDLMIDVNGEGAFVSACNFSGSLVTDSNVKQKIEVRVATPPRPIYLRAKMGINGMRMEDAFMFGLTNWIQATDGYLYFNQPVETEMSIGLCNEIKLNIQMELFSSTDYIMYFVVETSSENWNFDSV